MSSLDEFLQGATAVAPASSPPLSEEPTTVEPASTQPSGVVEIILPSGIEVYFQQDPKRLYRIRLSPDVEAYESDVELAELQRWREVISCSNVTGILDKPGLVHWGEEMGVSGVQELLRQNFVDAENLKAWTTEMVREVMKTKQLRTWQRRDKAATRGTSVHKALESWAMTGTLMDPGAFPKVEQGYVIGLNRWISESGFKPLRSEVIVASLTHGFAGRFDIHGELPEECKLVHKYTKAGKEHRKLFAPDSYLVDLKTSSGVYEEYHIQVAGYQGICAEAGYPRPNKTAILRVTADGHYEFVEGAADWLDFWFCKGLFDAIAAIKERS